MTSRRGMWLCLYLATVISALCSFSALHPAAECPVCPCAQVNDTCPGQGFACFSGEQVSLNADCRDGFVDCSGSAEAVWTRNRDAKCLCGPERAGMDCSLVSPGPAGDVDKYCPGRYFDGGVLNFAATRKRMVCEVEYEVDDGLLSLFALHDQRIELDTSNHRTLDTDASVLLMDVQAVIYSRLINYTRSDEDANQYVCGPVQPVITCNFEDCKGSRVINEGDERAVRIGECGKLTSCKICDVADTQCELYQVLNDLKSMTFEFEERNVNASGGVARGTIDVTLAGAIEVGFKISCRAGSCVDDVRESALVLGDAVAREARYAASIGTTAGLVLVYVALGVLLLLMLRKARKQDDGGFIVDAEEEFAAETTKQQGVEVEVEMKEFKAAQHEQNPTIEPLLTAVHSTPAEEGKGGRVILPPVGTTDAGQQHELDQNDDNNRLNTPVGEHEDAESKAVVAVPVASIASTRDSKSVQHPMVALDPSTPASTPALVFRDVSYAVRERGRILHGVDGHVGRHQLVAVMGPSGSGKTTLLEILGGERLGFQGTVRVRKGSSLGFVAQTDFLMATQTVFEAVFFAANLRAYAEDSSNKRGKVWDLERRIYAVLCSLKIEKLCHARIGSALRGGLSGGERRRVTIAMELVTRPSLLLLDEPLTGLDSTNASQLLLLLRRLADRGECGSLFTIHQAQSGVLKLFDGLLVLGNNGRVVYNGGGLASLDYLAAAGYELPPLTNPADFWLDLASTKADDLADAFAAQHGHTHGKKLAWEDVDGVDVAIARRGWFAGSVWTAWQALLRRELVNHARAPRVLIVHNVAASCVGLILGAVFYDLDDGIPGTQNRLGILFFFVLFFSMTSMSALPAFVADRERYWRETANGMYSTGPYVVSKVMSDMICLRLLPPWLFGCFVYGLVGFQAESSRFLTFCGVLLLCNLTSTAFCLLVSSICVDTPHANFTAVILLMAFMMFGGLFLNLKTNDVLAGISQLSFFRYAYELLAINEFSGIQFLFDADGIPTVRLTGELILDNIGMDVGNQQVDVIAVCVFLVVFVACCYASVKLLNQNPKRLAGVIHSQK